LSSGMDYGSARGSAAHTPCHAWMSPARWATCWPVGGISWRSMRHSLFARSEPSSPPPGPIPTTLWALPRPR
jgi:hypothetical protein